MIRTETVVIGGGPAGSATACGLAGAGRDVMLLERTAGPHHKVCGEFLSIETQLFLQRLGIDPLALGAVPVERVTVHSARRSVNAKLPFHALSLSRYRLDDALLRLAQNRGARVVRNLTVRSAMPNGDGWNLSCDHGETIHCRHLVTATGKLGLRGIDDERDSSLVGLKMHLRPSPQTLRELERRVELFFLDSSYIGLELIEDGIANLCLVLPRTAMNRIGPGWQALQDHLVLASPVMARRLADSEPLWDKPKAVVCPSGGHLHRDSKIAVYRVGDRLAHIPPFTGDGLAIALGSAALAAEHIQHGLPPDTYLAAARHLTAGPIRFASVLSRLTNYSASRSLLFDVASRAPGLIETIIRKTRLTLATAE